MDQLDIDKAYVSPYDRLLYTFDADHALSASQQKEITKHERIARLRDDATAKPSDDAIWEEF